MKFLMFVATVICLATGGCSVRDGDTDLDGVWTELSTWEYVPEFAPGDNPDFQVTGNMKLINTAAASPITMEFEPKSSTMNTSGFSANFKTKHHEGFRQITLHDSVTGWNRTGIYIVNDNSLLMLVHEHEDFPNNFCLQNYKDSKGKLIHLKRMRKSNEGNKKGRGKGRKGKGDAAH